MDRKQKKSLIVLLISVAVLFASAMVFLIQFFTTSISYLTDIGLFMTALFLFYAIIELILFYNSAIRKKAMGADEVRMRKSLSVFFIIFACSVLVAGVYPPFADGPVETVCLLLAFSYAVSEIVNFFLWSGDDVKEAGEQPVRLSVIMALFVLTVFMMLGILYFMHPGKGSPAAVADENRATTFITHPTEVIGSATTEEREPGEGLPATGTLISDDEAAPECMEPGEGLPDVSVLPDFVEDADESAASESVVSDTVSSESVVSDAVFGKEDVLTVDSETDFSTAEDAFVHEADVMQSLDAGEIAEDAASPVPIGGVSVPPAPVLAAPFAFTYESSPVVEEDDFWADFYIAGEDELIFEDGLYYMDLYINGSYVGLIETMVVGGDAQLNTSQFEDYLDGTLTDEASLRLFSKAGKYMSVSGLSDLGVRSSFHPEEYKVMVDFDVNDMPVQVLSIRSSSSKYVVRPVVDGIDLEPAAFTLSSKYSLNVYSPNFRSPDLANNIYSRLSVDNTGRLFDVHFDFDYRMSLVGKNFDFAFGSYKFHTDFPDEMIRLSWGNISTELLSPKGTNIGIRFDRNYSYGSGDIPRGNIEQVIVVEKQSDVQVFNDSGAAGENNEIFRRTLSPGIYRLRDFILYSGANRILIRITPLDGSAVQEKVIDVMYSAGLMAPGEVYYGLSLATGRIMTSSSATKDPYVLSIPLWNGRRMDYDFRNITLSGYVKAGILTNLSLNTSFAIQNLPDGNAAFKPNMQLSMELTHANRLGTSRYNLNAYEYSDSNGKLTVPYFNFRFGHQVSTGMKTMSSVSLSLGYSSPRTSDWTVDHDVYANIGLSGRIGIMGWSASSYMSSDVTAFDDFTWSLGLSTSFLLTNRITLSASLSTSGDKNGSTYLGGRISASVRFGDSYLSASATDSYASVDYSLSKDNHYFHTSLDTSDYADVNAYGLDASYTYSGKVFNTGLSLSADSLFEKVGGSFSLSTASIFADGLMAFSSYIPSNFLLVSQSGALKGNSLSVGQAGSTNMQGLPLVFGVGSYTGISSGGDSFVVYSAGEDVFSTVVTTPVNLRKSSRAGYVLRLAADNTYSASAMVILPDGKPWVNGSSPVYDASVVSGSMVLEPTDLYIFTDSDGRFVISDLRPGTYAFDVDYGSSWLLYVFAIRDDETALNSVIVMDDQKVLDRVSIPEPYAGAYEISGSEVMGADEFFLMLYPEMDGGDL